jgi:hypothetical protein
MSEAVESPKPGHAVEPRRAQSSRSAKAEVSTLTIITTLVVLLVFVGLVWLVFLQREAIPSDSSQKREERIKNLAQLNADNQKVLTTYHWIDKAKGTVGIPINRAMELVQKDLAANHPHAAGPVNPPAASPTPAATNQPAVTPAPSASASPAASPASSPSSSPEPTASPKPTATPESSPSPTGQ